ncbi:hypothetical protein M3223_20805 [Paenibacillus pasadenensis]|uniref:hypothetical protein n=1 Tax=Paenibacillus pasadenensis TaxID=217090 RepID=UPI002041034C|nr:hypothetical protein [Paenibacillus pasadenensis]MCM3749779.1 hypothetical protein [Paenibacillus pasadenensis]
MELYFKDNFFSIGTTDIMDSAGAPIGLVDLKVASNSTLEVFGANKESLYVGKFPFFSSKWTVLDAKEKELGKLYAKMALFNKRYEYDSNGRGLYRLSSFAHTSDYEITNDEGAIIATFKKTSGWLSPSAYRLNCKDSRIDPMEWVAVILGMNQIQKRQSAAAAT